MNTTGAAYDPATTYDPAAANMNTAGATVDPATGHHHHHHHAGREAAVGALAGHEGAHYAENHGNHEHHPVRDTLLGAGAGAETAHLRNEHQDHKAQDHAMGKPSIGDKISGTVDKIVGEVTNNPAKVQEGAMKKGQI